MAYTGYAHIDASTGKIVSSEIDVSSDLALLSTTTGIDGRSATTTDLYTVPNGKTCIPIVAVIRVTTEVGFAAAGSGGIGVAAGEDDIFPSTALTGLSASGKAFIFNNNLLSMTPATTGQVIKFGLDVGFTSTTTTLSIDLIGYLL